MSNTNEKTLYVFIDESGNLDFSRNGTRYFVFSAVATTDPHKSASSLQSLKYDLLKNGEDIEYFHASEDRQSVRNKVIDTISDNLRDIIKVHYIHADKQKAYQGLRTSEAFYSKLGTILVNYIVSYKSDGFSKIIIIFDKCLKKNDSSAFLKKIKPLLKETGKEYRIYFHRTLSDHNGQIADYFAWAKYISLERNELRPLRSLKGIKMTDFDLFRARNN